VRDLFEELKRGLSNEQLKMRTALYDESGVFNEISNALCYKLGCKKTADIFIDGLD
jgi:hypothetical protein